MTVKIHVERQHQNIFFTAEEKELSVSVELTIDHDAGKCDLMTGGEESVDFKGDTIEEGLLRAKAITAALKYLSEDKNYSDYDRIGQL